MLWEPSIHFTLSVSAYVCVSVCVSVALEKRRKVVHFSSLRKQRNPYFFCIPTGYQKERTMSTIFLNLLLSWWWFESKKNIKLFYFFVIVCFNSSDNGFYSHSYFSFCFRETPMLSVAVMLNHTFKFYATRSAVTKMAILATNDISHLKIC